MDNGKKKFKTLPTKRELRGFWEPESLFETHARLGIAFYNLDKRFVHTHNYPEFQFDDTELNNHVYFRNTFSENFIDIVRHVLGLEEVPILSLHSNLIRLREIRANRRREDSMEPFELGRENVIAQRSLHREQEIIVQNREYQENRMIEYNQNLNLLQQRNESYQRRIEKRNERNYDSEEEQAFQYRQTRHLQNPPQNSSLIILDGPQNNPPIILDGPQNSSPIIDSNSPLINTYENLAQL